MVCSLCNTCWCRPVYKTACNCRTKRKFRNFNNQKVFKLFYLENHGAAFGIFQEQRIPLLIITVLVLIFIGYIFHRVPHETKFIAIKWILVILVAGAVGNMIDRIYNGYVVDFCILNL